MAKATLLKGKEWHGQWTDNLYISQRPGQPTEEVSIKQMPDQPYSSGYRPESMVRQNTLLQQANERLRVIKQDPQRLADYQARFAAYCQEHGDTYLKNGKIHRRRLIDFIRQSELKLLFNSSKIPKTV